MYAKFLKTIAAYAEALDKVRDSVEPTSDDLTPYLGRIEVWLGRDLVGHLEDPDGIGWQYRERGT